MNFIRKIDSSVLFILPSLVISGNLPYGGWQMAKRDFVFIIIPLIDFWAGLDTHNVPAAETDQSEGRILLSICHLPVGVCSDWFSGVGH